MGLGADWCNAGRGFMMALGCIQAQTCHTGKCPTGVTTQDPRRQQALSVPDKATRVHNFHRSTLHTLKELVQAAGLEHPQQVNAHHIVRRLTNTEVRLLSNLVLQIKPGALLSEPEKQSTVFSYYWPLADAHTFRAVSSNLQAPTGPYAGGSPVAGNVRVQALLPDSTTSLQSALQYKQEPKARKAL